MMFLLNIKLFGKFCVSLDNCVLQGFESRKLQELLCYLLLYRDRPHPREFLATLLWDNLSTVQSKTYLRKALWQLQAAFDQQVALKHNSLVVIDPEWVQINSRACFSLDVDIFERAF